MGIGIGDPTGNITLDDAQHVALEPGIYSIEYQVSALLANSSYMQITPFYNGATHIEYGIYFMTGSDHSSAFGSVSFLVDVPTRTLFSLTFNSPVRATAGTLTMVIFKLNE
ncbi:hypothetical protein [Feifania hominis]|uniref:hypothetical protein n=1 Tax=Feifania hominis TaxID=2763660 RepID=UPI0020163E20|nr:hypothetical protein [Feifania hominis]